MPTPTKEELDSNDRDGYIGRCISVVEKEDSGRSHDANIAMCYSMWQQAKDKQ